MASSTSEPPILWCSARGSDGLIHRCWRRNMPDAAWSRVCRYAIDTAVTMDVLADPDRSAITCFWCIKDMSP